MKLKASVTIFLSLSLGTFIILAEVLAKSCIISSERLRFESAYDIALNSVLGEFSQQLRAQYDLFYVDTSYMAGLPSVSNLSYRIDFYFFQNTEKVMNVDNGPWGGIIPDSAMVVDYQTASAMDGMSMRSQANAYVEDTPSLGNLLETVSAMAGRSSEISSLEQRDILAEWGDVMAGIAAKELPKKKDPESGIEIIVELDNPADSYYEQSSGDILALTGTQNAVSGASIDTGSLISNKGVSNGHVMALNNDMSRNPYITYLVDRMSYFGHTKGHLLDCELEYIVSGRGSDYENFHEIVQRIYQAVLTQCFEKVSSDSYYVSMAHAQAEALEVCTLDPTFIEPVATSILYAYTFVEALKNMRSILQGGAGDFGITYLQYLIAMLHMKSDSELNLRAMDTMEIEVRKATSNPYFSMDWCVERIRCKLTGSGTGPHKLNIERTYGYF